MFVDFDNIDTSELREKMKNDALAAYFGGGIEEALFEYSQIDNASESDLLRMADRKGISLDPFCLDDWE